MPSSIPGISQSISRSILSQHFRSVTRSHSKARRALHFFGLIVVLLAPWKPLIAQLVQVNSISTIAGTAGSPGDSGDGGKATGATLNLPLSAVVDRTGNIFISDAGNNNVRKIAASTGIITTVAGNGTVGFSGDGGAATSAEFHQIGQIALDAAGNLYISDFGNNRVRKVNATTGIITTVAGNGSSTSSGDGGAATNAGLAQPGGIALDSAGDIFVVDNGELGIRVINATTGIITTVISNGSTPSPGFKGLEGIAIDGSGNFFIADTGNHEVFKLTASTGTISVVAGNGTQGYSGDGGAATSAGFIFTEGVALDTAGNLYISDADRIRKISAATGIISTVAGDGAAGHSGDYGAAVDAELNGPEGVALDSAGNLYIADELNSVVREVSPLAFPATNVASSSVPQNLFLQTTAAESITSFTVPVSQGNEQEYTVGTVTGCAVDGVTSNPAGTICTIPITFSPAYPGLRPVPLQAVTSGGKINIGLGGTGVGPLIAFAPGILSTLAGTSPAGNPNPPGGNGDGGPSTAASLFGPQGVAVDYAGNIYVADAGVGGGPIRRIDATTGIISGFAGEGRDGGDGGLAVNAALGATDVVLDSAGNFYLTDNTTQSVRIRRVDGATGIITTVAGASNIFAFPPPTPQPSNGDGGPATQATLGILAGVAIDRQANNLYFTDSQLNQVRKVDLTTGIISTLAGTGARGYTGDGGPATGATLDSPEGITVDSMGNVYFADDQNGSVEGHVVRRVDVATGIITTFAGNPSAPYTYNPTASYFPGEFPTGPATSIAILAGYLKFDSAGNLYITGFDAVRRVDAATSIVSAVASTTGFVDAQPGYIQPSGKPALGWLANTAYGIALDSAGNLFITSLNYLQKVDVSTSIFSFPTLTQVDTTDATDGPQPVNVANIGNAALMLAAPDPVLSPTSYTFDTTASNSCPQLNAGSSPATIAPGNSCAITLDFEPLVAPIPPASEVTIPGSVVLTDNSLNIATSTQTIPVTGRSFGEAAGPQPVLTPATMDFGSLTVGTTSAAQTATLSNTGGVPQSISGFGFFGSDASSFKETNNCGPSVAAGASCSIAITCTPSAAGALTASLGANFPSPQPQLAIALTCNGTAAGAPQAALSPASLNFTTVAGTTPAPQVATLTNSGTAALAISQVSIGGATGGAFSQTNTCGTSLAAGASCAITVSFSGTGVGSYPAALQVADNAPNTPQAVTLSGTVTAANAPGTPIAKLTPASLSYSATTGTTSVAQMVMLTNSGTATLNISGITLTGANPSDFAISSNACGATLAVAATCAISVTFTPSSAGSFSASVSVTDDAPGSPQTSVLGGTGAAPAAADFTVTATPAAQSVTSGSSATYNVTVASTSGSFTQAVALTASGLPPGATVTFSPASVTPGGSGAQASMIVQPAAQQTARANGLPRWPFTAPIFAAVLLLFPGKKIRLGKRGWGVFMSLVGIVALLGIATSTIGCGAGFALPSSAKTYTITVTGTSGSDTHSTTATLTLQ